MTDKLTKRLEEMELQYQEARDAQSLVMRSLLCDYIDELGECVVRDDTLVTLYFPKYGISLCQTDAPKDSWEIRQRWWHPKGNPVVIRTIFRPIATSTSETFKPVIEQMVFAVEQALKKHPVRWYHSHYDRFIVMYVGFWIALIGGVFLWAYFDRGSL